MIAVSILVVGAVAVWLGSGLLSATLLYAFFQREFPFIADMDRQRDTRQTWQFGLFGPFGLIAATVFLAVHGGLKHGLLWPGRRP